MHIFSWYHMFTKAVRSDLELTCHEHKKHTYLISPLSFDIQRLTRVTSESACTMIHSSRVFIYQMYIRYHCHVTNGLSWARFATTKRAIDLSNNNPGTWITKKTPCKMYVTCVYSHVIYDNFCLTVLLKTFQMPGLNILTEIDFYQNTSS